MFLNTINSTHKLGRLAQFLIYISLSALALAIIAIPAAAADAQPQAWANDLTSLPAGKGDNTEFQGAQEQPNATCPSGGQCFADVPPSSQFYTATNRLFQQDVITGFPCGGPSEPCDSFNRPYYRPTIGLQHQIAAQFLDNARRLSGIFIDTTGSVTPVEARTSANSGIGLSGTSSGTSGIGVLGISTDSVDGVGVSGRSSSSSGRGVVGTSSGGSTSAGVEGYNNGTGSGVFGWSFDRGVWGYTYGGSTSAGVYGSSAGSGAGVIGNSFSGNGVYGVATTGSGIGVYGRATSTGPGVYGYQGGSGPGVNGYSHSGQGVVGFNYTGSGYGVFGYSAGNRAGYFSGNVQVTGSLSKGAGSFKIDHPLDPENKYLYHSFVESPDMKNIYDGVAILDSKGEATVTMPDWFSPLNTDFRYQLTTIGNYAPVYIAQEIAGNAFKIAGGKADMKVSWQVTGIRQDPYANAHRIPVEEAKPEDERGTYLHPTEWGKPESLGVDYEERQRIEQTAQDHTKP